MDRRKVLQTSSLFALTSGLTVAADALDQSSHSHPAFPTNSGQQAKLAAHWAFDEASNVRTLESVAQVEDLIQGKSTFHEGIQGRGIKFDGTISDWMQPGISAYVFWWMGWRDCVSDAGVPFMQWSHVAASFRS